LFAFLTTPKISNVAALLISATDLIDRFGLLQIMQIWSGMVWYFADYANHWLKYFRFVAKFTTFLLLKLLTSG
jgi:hypothetical protein